MLLPGAVNRREFGRSLIHGTSALLAATPAVFAANATSEPEIPSGVASGDVSADGAVVWSRSDRPARMFVDVATNDQFRNAKRIRGPAALGEGDFTAKLRLSGLPAGTRIFYRVLFEDLADPRLFSKGATGCFRTAPLDKRSVTFAWSGDTAGQGYGIDPARGGMRTYETIRKLAPDFFVHCGDHIYADNPFPPKLELDDGTQWNNRVTEETSKVAETLAEFHANYRYNLLDEHVRGFNAEVPMFAQWDDHETTNNWYPGEQLAGDHRYVVKSASLLAARARRAFFDYLPLQPRGAAGEGIYRAISYGPLLELFFLDMRSYRGPNTANRQHEPGDDTALLGRHQLQWLKRSMLGSRAVWKVVCSDMPLGLIVPDADAAFENAANGDGPPLGRELEIAELLGFLQVAGVRNVVWLTADVHYAASHYYDPQQARFRDFDPFWEFVSGPLHAGTFGPNKLDDTFGPQLRFCSIPEGMKPNRPPSDGLQFFGLIAIDGQTEIMTVTHYNVAGNRLWSADLEPR
jgi:alkaline phosphatase D